MLFTVDRNCYLVAYQELLTIKRETGCVPGVDKLVAYQKKRNWLRTRRSETGCVPEKEKLVAYQKKKILVAYQELTNKQLLTSKGYQVDN